jgi:hypothetical protein
MKNSFGINPLKGIFTRSGISDCDGAIGMIKNANEGLWQAQSADERKSHAIGVRG